LCPRVFIEFRSLLCSKRSSWHSLRLEPCCYFYLCLYDSFCCDNSYHKGLHIYFIFRFLLFMSPCILQDLSDVEGDKKYNIVTFASTYGVETIARVAAFLLIMSYSSAMAIPCILPKSFKMLPMVSGHLMLLIYFLLAYRELIPSDMQSLKIFYKSIWNLFYLEYCLYPFI